MKSLVKNKGKILALDFGDKHSGVAVSDDSRTLSFGRGTIRNYKSLNELFRKIKDLCDKEGVTEVLMGVPMGKGETSQVDRMQKIGMKLKDYLKLPLIYVDESFSTFEAERKLQELGIKPIEWKKSEDEMAAILILQKHLDEIE